jgi:hypothetical protein
MQGHEFRSRAQGLFECRQRLLRATFLKQPLARIRQRGSICK